MLIVIETALAHYLKENDSGTAKTILGTLAKCNIFLDHDTLKKAANSSGKPDTYLEMLKFTQRLYLAKTFRGE